MREMLEKTRQVWRILYQNRYSFVAYGSLIQLFMSSVGVAILAAIFNLMLRIAGEPNLTKDNFMEFFSSPASIVATVIYIVAAAGLIFFEFALLVTLVNSRRIVGRFSARRVFASTIKNMKSIVLGGQIFFFVPYFISLIPLGNLGLTSVIARQVRIPDFIIGEISKTGVGIVAVILSLAMISYFNLRFIFAFPLAILHEDGLIVNLRRSWSMTRRDGLKKLLPAVFVGIIFAIIGLLVVFVASFVVPAVFGFLGNLMVQSIFLAMADAVNFGVLVASKIAIVVAGLFAIYGDGFSVESGVEKRRQSVFVAVSTGLVLLVAIVSNGVFIYRSPHATSTLKISHRGDIGGGVENSLEALRSAKNSGANLIEIDTMLTRDGEFVVIHDNNLRRLAGVASNVSSLTLSEIKNLTIRANGFESKIPTLREFVEESQKINADLLIEIKPHGSEPDNFAEMVVAELRRLDIVEKYRVMSIDFDLISKVEEIEPKIKTGLVVPFVVGDFAGDFEFYAVEDFSYRARFLGDDKEIFVWTINDKGDMMRYFQAGVGGIITDDLDTAREVERNLATFSRQRLMELYFSR